MSRCAVIILTLVMLVSPARADDALPPGANKLCPVMTDQPTKADRFVDHNGKRIYFCCDKCVAKFKLNPDKYLTSAQGSPEVASRLSGPASRFNGKLWQLFGKLHVVVVHFPIALIMIAGIIELVRLRKRTRPSDAAFVCLAVGALAAVTAAAMGWINAANNFSPSKILTIHRWLGVTLAGASIIALLIATAARKWPTPMRSAYLTSVFLCAAWVGAAGHFGGTLTYGEDYYTSIFKAPAKTQAIATVAVSPTTAPVDDANLQAILYGTPEQARMAKIKLRLAQLPAPPAPPTTDKPTFNAIDQFIAAKWPAATVPQVCDDAAFVRRIYLDVIGVIPTVEESTRFMDDKSPDKRVKLIDLLLARIDDYAAHWTPFFEEAIGSSPFPQQGGVPTHGNYQPWVFESFKTNRPYDVMLAQLIDPTAPGFQKKDPVVANTKVSKVGYIMNESHKDTLQSAANVGQFFLGTGMKCASCHSHFLNDEWPQTKFLGFAGMFADKDLELIRCEKESGKFVPAHFAFDIKGAPTTVPSDPNERLHLVTQLILDPANPRFAKTAVNRLWKRYFGLGLFEPADDFRLDSPASHPELLEWLAYDFVASGYDLKHTIRLILTSRTYQLKYDPKLEDHFDIAKRDEPRYYRSPSLRKLTAEQLLDSVRVAVEQKLDDKTRLYHNTQSSELLRTLGRPQSRQEISTARPEDVAIVQALQLLNGEEWSGMVYRSPILAPLAEEKDSSKVVDHLYRVALSRAPTPDETQVGAQFLKDSPPPTRSHPTTQEIVLLDDEVPAGSKFVPATQPVFSGTKSFVQVAANDQQIQQTLMKDDGIVIGSPNDVLFAYVFIEPKSAAKEIMLQWNDGAWNHRAYWGANQIAFGEDGTPTRWRMDKKLPEAGKWIRLEIPAKIVGFNAGLRIYGISFDQVGGKIYWDKAGIVKQPSVDAPALGDLLWALFTSPEFQYIR